MLKYSYILSSTALLFGIYSTYIEVQSVIVMRKFEKIWYLLVYSEQCVANLNASLIIITGLLDGRSYLIRESCRCGRICI